VWVFAEDSSTRRDLVAIEYYMGDVRLSPDARYIALCTEDRELEAAKLPGKLTVVPVAGGPGKALMDCERSWTFYWYDEDHIVIGGRGVIHFVGIDGKFVVLAQDASLVAQRRNGLRQ
jgi:hypothetical protein